MKIPPPHFKSHPMDLTSQFSDLWEEWGLPSEHVLVISRKAKFYFFQVISRSFIVLKNKNGINLHVSNSQDCSHVTFNTGQFLVSRKQEFLKIFSVRGELMVVPVSICWWEHYFWGWVLFPKRLWLLCHYLKKVSGLGKFFHIETPNHQYFSFVHCFPNL